MMEESGGKPVGVQWNTSGLTSSYCNVASAVATQTGVVLNLGLNQRADLPGGGLKVELLHRVVLDPLAAKHLQQLLSRVIAEHDARHGTPR